MKIFCIIVIYNTHISNSITFSNLINSEMNPTIIIIDNTDNGIDNSDCVTYKNVRYFSMEGNKGLSKAYNAGLKIIRQETPHENDIIILLDDDTAISDEYLKALCKQAEFDCTIDIFAPVIQGQTGIFYSPARAGFFKNYYIRNEEEDIPQKSFFAIASCSSIRWRVLQNYFFNEDFFVDLIDNNFYDEQRKKKRVFRKINVIIQQNFALKNNDLTYERIIRRLSTWIPDFKVYCWQKPVRFFGFFPDIVLRGMMLSLKCRNPKVLFWMIKHSVKVLWKKDKSQEDKYRI